MSDYISIEENLPHEVSELICLKCLNRWIGVYPEETQLKNLECKCGAVGYVIKTGQTLDDSDSADTECESCDHFKNGKCILNLHNSDIYYCGYWKEGGRGGKERTDVIDGESRRRKVRNKHDSNESRI